MARHDVRISSIVIVGHSLGAGAAVGLAEELQRAGVRVALVVTFAPIVRTAIPSNVQQLKNFPTEWATRLSGAITTAVHRRTWTREANRS
jgi:thioesterase domain-containing protein